jgi:glycine cleavage system transcriptional repressor
MQQLVISAIGPDRPGIVDSLTEALSRHAANIADSRMINLRGRFAVVMLVEVPADRPDAVVADVQAAATKLGLTATVQRADDPAGKAVKPAVPYRIRTYAMDQVGLVHRITHVLHMAGVNIEELSTQLDHAPHTGAPIFSMDMIVTVPASTKLKQVRDDLERICGELNCDLDIDKV